MNKITILVPVYNEKNSLLEIIKRIEEDVYKRQVINMKLKNSLKSCPLIYNIKLLILKTKIWKI